MPGRRKSCDTLTAVNMDLPSHVLILIVCFDVTETRKLMADLRELVAIHGGQGKELKV